MGTGFGKLMKQAKQMKENFAKMQEELKDKTVEAAAGGGAVKATVDGEGKLLSVKIDPEVVKSGDVEMLEDLILTAVNQAKEKADELHASAFGDLTKGLGIPGLGG